MKLALLALVALLPLAIAAPIPFVNCGAPDDHITIDAAFASVWPPVPGSPLTIDFSGSLDEELTGGTYEFDVNFDGFQLVSQRGELSDLQIPFPVAAGDFNVSHTVMVPSVISGGSVIIFNSTAYDSEGEELSCIQLVVEVPQSATSIASAAAASSPLAQLAKGALAGRTSMKEIASSVSQLLEAASAPSLPTLPSLPFPHPLLNHPLPLPPALNHLLPRHLARPFGAASTSVTVPYTNCGSSSDQITISSFTSTEWPPVLGTSPTITVVYTANEEIDGGSYTSVISVDGLPLISKTENLSKMLTLPLAKGAHTTTKTTKLPSFFPFSGQISAQVTAVDSNNDQLLCISVSFTI